MAMGRNKRKAISRRFQQVPAVGVLWTMGLTDVWMLDRFPLIFQKPDVTCLRTCEKIRKRRTRARKPYGKAHARAHPRSGV
jgi:hypothetical protein